MDFLLNILDFLSLYSFLKIVEREPSFIFSLGQGLVDLPVALAFAIVCTFDIWPLPPKFLDYKYVPPRCLRRY